MLCRAVPASTRFVGADQPRSIGPPFVLTTQDAMNRIDAIRVPMGFVRRGCVERAKDAPSGSGARNACAGTSRGGGGGQALRGYVTRAGAATARRGQRARG